MGPYRIERFDTVVSTNELVLHGLDKGYDEGLVCRAAEQVGGYGRQGRSWSSPRGGLYQSMLLRPDAPTGQLPTLGLVAAIAVRKALLSMGALMSGDVQLKWPNDVMCAQGKLCGISCESHAGGLCIGIGVNVFRPLVEEPVGGKNTPAYLADIARVRIDRDRDGQTYVEAVGDEVLVAFWRRYAQWQREGFAPFVDEFNACSALTGKRVDIVDRNGTVVSSGVVGGIDVNGSLFVGDRPISSGEAHIR